MVASFALNNADIYHKQVRIVSDCCGVMLVIRPRRVYEVSVCTLDLKEDDWGNPVIRKSK